MTFVSPVNSRDPNSHRLFRPLIGTCHASKQQLNSNMQVYTCTRIMDSRCSLGIWFFSSVCANFFFRLSILSAGILRCFFCTYLSSLKRPIVLRPTDLRFRYRTVNLTVDAVLNFGCEMFWFWCNVNRSGFDCVRKKRIK